MGKILTTDATLQCPHGGSISITSSNQKAKAGGSIVLSTDTFSISGCSNLDPSKTNPDPCTTIQWTVTDQQVKVNGTPTLSDSSVGLCFSATQIPQGPLTIVNTQKKVQSR